MFDRRLIWILIPLGLALVGIVSLLDLPGTEGLETTGPVQVSGGGSVAAGPVDVGDISAGSLTLEGVPAEVRAAADVPRPNRGDWSIGGRVRLGTYGSLADGPLMVRLFAGNGAEGEPLMEARIRSDAHGEFEWTTTQPELAVTVSVVPELEGHKVGASTRFVASGEPGPLDMQPYAYALDARIVGRVLDGDGNGVADALVWSHLSEARTGADGRYVLPMDSTYPAPVFRALAEGYCCERFAVGALEPGEVRGPDVVLRPELAVEGRVVDSSGQPLAGATVTTYPFDRMKVETSADGRFRLGGLDPGTGGQRVYAKKEGLVGPSHRVTAESLAGLGEEGLEFILGPGGSVAGRVVTDRGKPVRGAVVCCNGYPSSDGPGTTRTDADGTFQLTNLRPDANQLWARHPRWAAGTISFRFPSAEAELSDLEIVLTEGFGLTGRVLDEAGDPIAGAEVRPSPMGRGMYVGDSVRSDPEGLFTLKGIRSERFVVQVFAEGFDTDEEIVEAGTDVVLRPKRAGGLAGLVLDGATGKPLDHFVVRFVRAQLGPGEEAMTSYGAEWSRPGVSFAGTDGAWDSGQATLSVGAVTGLEVTSPGYAATLVEHAVVALDPKPANLRIEMFGGATLRGHVVEASSGASLAGARVRRFTAGNSRDTPRFVADRDQVVLTDDQGRFEMTSVPFGAMFLIVDQTELPIYIDGPFEVDAGAAALERTVAVTGGGQILGRFLDGEGRPLAGQSVQLAALETPDGESRRVEAQTGADGEFELRCLSPGPYFLTGIVTEPGASMPVGAGLVHFVEVEDSQQLDFDLRPAGRATLSGTVEFDGDLPEGVSVTLRPKQAPSLYQQRSVKAALLDGTFTAPYLDAGEWRADVFLQQGGSMIAGSAKVQVPAEGAVEVHLTLQSIGR